MAIQSNPLNSNSVNSGSRPPSWKYPHVRILSSSLSAVFVFVCPWGCGSGRQQKSVKKPSAKVRPHSTGGSSNF